MASSCLAVLFSLMVLPFPVSCDDATRFHHLVTTAQDLFAEKGSLADAMVSRGTPAFSCGMIDTRPRLPFFVRPRRRAQQGTESCSAPHKARRLRTADRRTHTLTSATTPPALRPTFSPAGCGVSVGGLGKSVRRSELAPLGLPRRGLGPLQPPALPAQLQRL